MFTATFIFEPGTYDAEFHALDARIAEAARAIPGYLGEDSSTDPATGEIRNVYRWQTLAALRQLADHPDHRAAKARAGRWLRGWRVEIAEVADAGPAVDNAPP